MSSPTAYYYRGDGKLAALDKRTCLFQVGVCLQLSTEVSYDERSTFEEYRYDALGRRVWVRTRQDLPATRATATGRCGGSCGMGIRCCTSCGIPAAHWSRTAGR